jgi:GH18 family chitinase
MPDNEDQVRLKGRDWVYDAEQGIYRPMDPPESLWSKWGWVACVIVLGLMCWLLER